MTVAILTHRVFRLFISSTFSDFVAEREALQKRVFPELEKFCAERGARFQAVDLRWGITEEAQQEHDTLRICLEEVRRCQSLSPRPNFAVLLGDRYGWEPVPARIPIDHWKRLLVAAAGPDVEAIHAGYEGPDLNAIPPTMHLRKRKGDWASNEEREALLRAALRRAADAAGFSGDERLPYFASATHQEIALGALDSQDEEGNRLHPEEHVQVYVRHIEGLPDDATARAFIDWDKNSQAPVPGARERLSSLDATLRRQLTGKVQDIQARWSNSCTDESHIVDFCEKFLADQKASIERELGSRQAVGDGAERNAKNIAFAKERARNFVGRTNVLKQVNAYVTRQGQTSPLILHGDGGTGKSALMAKAYQQALEGVSRQSAVLLRFIGGVPGTESLMTLLTDLTADIESAYGRPAPQPPETMKAAREAFQAALKGATPERPLVLFLDALDQLDNSDGAWLLEWLPRELGKHVRVIASTRPGQTLMQAQDRYSETLIKVPPMTPAEGKLMLDSWLADSRDSHYNAGIVKTRGRRLTPIQRKLLLSTFDKTGTPLWLKLAYEEARSWASWYQPLQLPISVEAMVEDLVTRRLLESDNHPRAFATRALAYLTAARFGLADEELDHALATDLEVKAEFEAQNAKTGQAWEFDLKRPRLPPILWSRLYFDLQPYLTHARVDGTVLYRWFHREFKEVIGKKYLSRGQCKQETHEQLAETFFALAPYSDELFKYTDASGTQLPAALRRVMEQPWQLAQAERYEALNNLLSDFGFCMGKCAANRVDDLREQYQYLVTKEGSTAVICAWFEVIRSKGHLLRQGDRAWPAHRILLQIASEHADNSPLTLSAQRWLESKHCDWIWIRNKNRPSHYQPSLLHAVLEGHKGPIKGVKIAFGEQLLTWCGGHENTDFCLRIWDRSNGALLTVMEGHTDEVNGADVMPDGRVLSWSNDGTLRLWDGQSGAQMSIMDGHTSVVIGALLLPDGRALSWSSDNTLSLWDAQSGVPLISMLGHTAAILSAQILTDGRLLSWSQDGTLRLWDDKSGAVMAIMLGHTASVLGAKILIDGRLLSWSRDKTMRIWDMTSGKSLMLIDTGYEIEHPLILDDCCVLTWNLSSKDLIIWNLQSGAVVAKLVGHTSQIFGVQILSNGRVLSWSGDGNLRLWDSQNGAPIAVMEGHSSSVQGAQALDDRRVLSWSLDGTLRLWNSQSGAPLLEMKGHSSAVKGAIALPNGQFLSWSDDRTLRMWDAETGVALAVMEEHTSRVTNVISIAEGMVVSWAGRWQTEDTFQWGGGWDQDNNETDSRAIIWNWKILTPNKAQQVESPVLTPKPISGSLTLASNEVVSWSFFEDHFRVWNVDNGSELGVIEAHPETESTLSVIPISNDRFISWCESDEVIKVWSLEDGDLLATLDMQDTTESPVVLSPNRLLACGSFGNLILWDLNSYEALVTLTGCSYLSGAQQLEDGRILSWDTYGDNSLWLWDPADTELDLFSTSPSVPVIKLTGHSAPVRGARALPSGKIVSWASEHALRLWDGKSGAPLGLMEGHTGSIRGLEVLPDGQIITWSDDCTLRIWDEHSKSVLKVFKGYGLPQFVQVLNHDRILILTLAGLAILDIKAGNVVAWIEQPACSPQSMEEAQQLPDGRLISWSVEGLAKIWDEFGTLIDVYDRPWTYSCRDPYILSNLIKTNSAKKFGAFWVQANGTDLVVAESCDKWKARWFGQVTDIDDFIGSTLVCRGHKRINFLDLQFPK